MANPKLIKRGNSMTVAIPRAHLENAGFKDNEGVIISSVKGEITITKKEGYKCLVQS